MRLRSETMIMKMILDSIDTSLRVLDSDTMIVTVTEWVSDSDTVSVPSFELFMYFYCRGDSKLHATPQNRCPYLQAEPL